MYYEVFMCEDTFVQKDETDQLIIRFLFYLKRWLCRFSASSKHFLSTTIKETVVNRALCINVIYTLLKWGKENKSNKQHENTFEKISIPVMWYHLAT